MTSESSRKRSRSEGHEFQSVARRSTGNDEVDSLPAMWTCPSCNDHFLRASATYFTLGCRLGCKICANCFSERVVAKGCDPFFACTLCDSEAQSFATITPRVTKLRSKFTRRPDTDPYELNLPSKKGDPVQYWRELVKDGNSDHMSMIGLTMMGFDAENGKKKVYSDIFDQLDCNEWSEEQGDVIDRLFLALHSLLIHSDTQRRNRRFDPMANPSKEALERLAVNDNSALHRAMFALSTGGRLSDARTDGSRWRKNIVTTWAVTDIIRHVMSTLPGAVKDIMGAQLLAQDVSQNTFSILNEIGVCPSMEAIRKNEIATVVDKLIVAYESDNSKTAHDFLILLYDNVGFRETVLRVGFVQYVKLTWVWISHKKLIEWKIYPDPESTVDRDEQGILSTANRKEWAEEREHPNIFETVVAPTQEGMETIAQRSLSTIDTLLQLRLNSVLPNSVGEARAVLQSGTVIWPDSIPFDYGSTTVVENDTNVEAVRYIPIGEPNSPKTPLRINNATIDVPMKEDLNKKSTVKAIANYALSSKEHMLHRPKARGLEHISPILEEIGVTLAGDGQPTHMLFNIKREEPEEYKDITPALGGFHAVLTGWKSNGSLFGGTNQRESFVWRDSEKQKDWVMDPGDPNQVEGEMEMYILGQYHAAIVSLLAIRGPGATILSSVDVLDHMLARAKDYPICLSYLIQIRFAELQFVALEAESSADHIKYHDFLRILGVFCCSSHSPKYVSLICDYFVEWHCKSDAERKIWIESVLFRDTVNGSKIFADRFVEWLVEDLRIFLGKHSSGMFHENYVKRVALMLDSRKTMRAGMKSDPEGKEKSGLRLSTAFFETFVMAMDMNLWGTGPPRKVESKRATKRGELDLSSENQFKKGECRTPSGKTFNPESCFVYSTGLSRFKDYFRTFLIEGDLNDPKRPETDAGVRLSLINPSVNETEESFERQYARCASVDVDEIEELYTAGELKSLIRSMNEDQLPAERKIKGYSNKKKKAVAQLIVSAREFLIGENPSWAEEQREPLHAQHMQSMQSANAIFQTRVNEEMDLEFYSFKETEVREAFEEKKYTFGGVGGHGGGDDTQPAPPLGPPHRQGSGHSYISVVQSSQSTIVGMGTGNLRDQTSPCGSMWLTNNHNPPPP